MEGWGEVGVGGQFEKKFRKNCLLKSQALLGLNLMGFTDLFYKDILLHFL